MGRPGLRLRAKSTPFPRLCAPPQAGTHVHAGRDRTAAGSVPAHPRAGSAPVRASAVPFSNLRDSSENRESPGSSEELNRFSSVYWRTPSLCPGLRHPKYFTFEEQVFRFFFYPSPPLFPFSLCKVARKPALPERRAPRRGRDAAASAPASPPRASRRPATERDTPGGAAPGWDGS